MSNIIPVNQGLAPSQWQDELAKYAQEASTSEKFVAGKFFSIKGGALTLDDQPIKGNAVDVVVVGSIFENTYYPGKYDPNNVSPPTCYAFGDTEAGMAPHPDAAEPQSESCATCKWNKWGSSSKGEGKACQNRRRLAMIPAGANDLDAANVQGAEVVYLKVPVTSTRYWAAFVKGLANIVKRPPFAVVTRFAAHPDPRTQVRLSFDYAAPLPDEVIPAVLARVEEQKEAIRFPYSKPEAAEAAAPAKKEKF